MLRAAAHLALVFGAFLALAELARNWGNWQWWPFWLVDFIAAGLLVAGASRTLRERPGGGALLAGAWGFTTAMFYMSFWSHIEHIDEAAEGNLAQGPLTSIIGVLWIVTLVGFGLTLAAVRRRDV
jgi:peptidoglycan/LPS O-acetylase OafA/YrhL